MGLILTGSFPEMLKQSLETAFSHRGPSVSCCPGCWAGAVLHKLGFPGRARIWQCQKEGRGGSGLPSSLGPPQEFTQP